MSKHIKRYLSRYREACDELDSLTEEHERIISNIMSITPSYGGDSGPSGAKDKVGDGVAELVDHCRKIDDEIKYYIAVRDDVRSVVREVMHENVTCGQSLHYRYIMGWSPIVVASNMGYSERQGHPPQGARTCEEDSGKAGHGAKSAANRRFPCGIV